MDVTSALEVVEEIPDENSDILAVSKPSKATDAECVERGFTCDAYNNKRFFVDDIEQQNVTKLPRVNTRRLRLISDGRLVFCD